jgi:hypothetical protein
MGKHFIDPKRSEILSVFRCTTPGRSTTIIWHVLIFKVNHTFLLHAGSPLKCASQKLIWDAQIERFDVNPDVCRQFFLVGGNHLKSYNSSVIMTVLSQLLLLLLLLPLLLLLHLLYYWAFFILLITAVFISHHFRSNQSRQLIVLVRRVSHPIGSWYYALSAP